MSTTRELAHRSEKRARVRTSGHRRCWVAEWVDGPCGVDEEAAIGATSETGLAKLLELLDDGVDAFAAVEFDQPLFLAGERHDAGEARGLECLARG